MRFFLLLLAAVAVQPTFAVVVDNSDIPQAVLFVGNSFSYYNNGLQNHFRKLSAAGNDGIAPHVRLMAISGARLSEHTGLPDMLAARDWSVVVLQGYSSEPIRRANVQGFQEAARHHAGSIRDAGARPVFFMTWAYTGQPAMTEELAEAYTRIGDELDARVVPVGLAFAAVTRDRADIALRLADGKHPTLAGTYLAACVFYAALFGRSPEGLEYEAALGSEIANYLQRVAWDTVVSYAREGDAR